jgi:hypothetical protein
LEAASVGSCFFANQGLQLLEFNADAFIDFGAGKPSPLNAVVRRINRKTTG